MESNQINKMKIIIFFSLFYCFFTLEKCYAQANLDTIPLFGIEDDVSYKEKLNEVFFSKKFKGIVKDTAFYGNGKKGLDFFINHTHIYRVLYTEFNKDYFITLCETAPNSSTYYSLFFNGENGYIAGFDLGRHIMGFYKKKWNDYTLLIIKHYFRDSTRENSIGYLIVAIDDKTHKSNFVTISEWLESPVGSFSGSIKTVLDTIIEFKIINNDFYLIQKNKSDMKEIERMKFEGGNFVKVK